MVYALYEWLYLSIKYAQKISYLVVNILPVKGKFDHLTYFRGRYNSYAYFSDKCGSKNILGVNMILHASTLTQFCID